MATETEIANLALSLISSSRITSIDDVNDPEARAIKTVFTHERDKMLQQRPWSFAKKMTSLSKLATAPVYKWRAAYQLPADFLRLVEIDQEDAWNPTEYFDIMGKDLLMFRTELYEDAADTVTIEYVFTQADTSSYSPLFCDALAHALAARVARKITGSDAIAANLMEASEKLAMPKAATADGQQTRSGVNHPIRDILTKSLMLRARRSGQSSNVGYENW